MKQAEYQASRNEAKRCIARVQAEVIKKQAETLDSKEGRQNIFRIAKQKKKERKDITGTNCLKGDNGELLVQMWTTVVQLQRSSRMVLVSATLNSFSWFVSTKLRSGLLVYGRMRKKRCELRTAWSIAQFRQSQCKTCSARTQ